uniref:Glycoside hydrolase family 38 N-terminal domain-containing protein n=1 Tax=Acrobeloides nanus TaxID=290746 RepID=A0A914E6T4_9BILA
MDEPFIENEQQAAINGKKINIDKILNTFIEYINSRIRTQTHPHYLVMMGDDYTHTLPDSFMLNLEKLINYLNKMYSGVINAFFSTPSCYFKAITEIKRFKPGVKHDDFFPYAVKPHAYWAGFFTSKPAIKGLLRKTSALLQV